MGNKRAFRGNIICELHPGLYHTKRRSHLVQAPEMLQFKVSSLGILNLAWLCNDKCPSSVKSKPHYLEVGLPIPSRAFYCLCLKLPHQGSSWVAAGTWLEEFSWVCFLMCWDPQEKRNALLLPCLHKSFSFQPERRRIDAFELWCWRRLLRVPWTARRSNQSLLKEISPQCSLDGMIT